MEESTPYSLSSRPPTTSCIENIAVDPGLQGRGVGRELMGFAEEFARERGLPEIRLYTHRLMSENLAIYDHLGYRGDRRARRGGLRAHLPLQALA